MLKSGRLISLSLFLILLGALILGYTRQFIRELDEIAGWTAAPATLVTVRIVKKMHYAKPMGYQYYPEILYSYDVQGAKYQGSRLAVARERASSLETVQEWVNPLLTNSASWRDARTSDGNECWIPGPAPTRPLTIYFDPQNPAASILDNRDHTRMRVGRNFSHIIMILGFLGALSGMVFRKRPAGQNVGTWPRTSEPDAPAPPRTPQNWIEWGREADRLFKAGDLEKSLECYEQAICTNWGEPGTMAGLADHKLGKAKCLVLLGRGREALEPLAEAIARYENVGFGPIDEAREFREKALRQAPRP